MSDRLHRLAVRNIRFVTAVYLLAIIVATHWPKLRLNIGDSPYDKLMHFFGFGIAVGLVHASLWIRSWWGLLVFGFLFTYLDEVTQSTLTYGRTYSFPDIVAGWLGVSVMVMLILAIRPTGGHLARSRRRAWLDASASLLSRPNTWMILGCSGALGLMVGSVTLLLLDSLFVRPQPARALVIGAVFGFILAAHWTFEVGHRRERGRIATERRCRGCGHRHAEAAADEPDACMACDRAVQPDDWDPPVEIARPQLLKALFLPALFGGLALFLIMFGWLFVNVIRTRLATVDTLNWWAGLGLESQGVIDLTFGGLVFAWLVWMARRRIARLLDASAGTCIACGHDLTGVPLRSSCGHCPECGVRFRIAPRPLC